MSATIRPRLVPRTPADRIRRLNLRTRWWEDMYHSALTMRWGTYALWYGALYLALNGLFAILYLAQPGSIGNARPGSFLDAFFYSVQCISTIGFGTLTPATLYANVLTTAEAMVSLAITALVTGSVFARISRPQARVMFARTAVITPFNGTPTLQIRLGNERMSQIVAAEATVHLLRNERTAEGDFFRRFYDLALVRTRTPVFSMTYTVMHQIDAHSPLFGVTAAQMEADQIELVVSVTGLEETTSQAVHARASYQWTEVQPGHRYRDIFGRDPAGQMFIDFGRFHDTEPT